MSRKAGTMVKEVQTVRITAIEMERDDVEERFVVDQQAYFICKVSSESEKQARLAYDRDVHTRRGSHFADLHPRMAIDCEFLFDD